MTTLRAERAQAWLKRLQPYQARTHEPLPVIVEGKLIRMVGLTMEAVGCQAPIGARCSIVSGEHAVDAEVVGFAHDHLYLMPIGLMRGIVPHARVIPSGTSYRAPVGRNLLGRVIDGNGKAIDGKGPLKEDAFVSLYGSPINPLQRDRISQPLDVGVTAINALFTIGRGQRMGLFAGSGVGKSVLLGMMTRFTAADIVVVALIGERGREVKDFIEINLGNEGMSRAVVVAVPADAPPVLRLHGADLATRIAEYFRDQGLHVLLLMDSLTRYAQAQREIALAIGEPPATRGYPPSVFAKISQIVERTGNGDAGRGSITAFYTVLVEGDDQQDPVADATRAILDGHLVLSRTLAEAGVYPAIDVEASVSRVMSDIAQEGHLAEARKFRQISSTYQQNRDLVNVGAYVAGTDPQIDEAVAMQPAMSQFMQQGMHQKVTYAESLAKLHALLQASPRA
ncbi:MAG: flagellar protein export ATPase FliI [Pseudomonadota bacterium]